MCSNEPFAIGTTLFQSGAAVRADDIIGLNCMSALGASRPKGKPNGFFYLFPKLLEGWKMEAEREPPSTYPEAFGALLTKNFPPPQGLTFSTNSTPTVLADTHCLSLAVLVTTHRVSPNPPISRISDKILQHLNSLLQFPSYCIVSGEQISPPFIATQTCCAQKDTDLEPISAAIGWGEAESLFRQSAIFTNAISGSTPPVLSPTSHIHHMRFCLIQTPHCGAKRG